MDFLLLLQCSEPKNNILYERLAWSPTDLFVFRHRPGQAPAPDQRHSVVLRPAKMSQTLLPHINADEASVSNAQSELCNVSGLLAGTSIVRSDLDAQLLFLIPFKQPVRLTGISLRGVDGEAPTVLKVFAGKTTFAFDDVSSTPATASFALTAATSGKTLSFISPGIKFPAAVSSIAIFVDGDGAETTALESLTLWGTLAAQGADLSNLAAG